MYRRSFFMCYVSSCYVLNLMSFVLSTVCHFHVIYAVSVVFSACYVASVISFVMWFLQSD
jgi:hypothetical protein